MYTVGCGHELPTLTAGVDNIVGTGSDNTIDGSLAILSGQGWNTLGSADKIDGGAGTDTLFVQTTGAAFSAAPASLKNVEVLQLDLARSTAAATTINLQSGDASLTTIKSGNNQQTAGVGNATVAVNNVQSKVATVELTNANDHFTLTAAATALAGTADALALNLNAVTAGTVTVSAATGTNGYETINVASNGSVANVLTSLTQGATNNTLATINVTGATNLNLGAALDNTVTKVDANAFTGQLNVTAGASNITITGGTGNDTISLAGTYSTADVVNGGAGTDTLSLNSAEAIVTTAQSNVTNFETLSIANQLNGAVDATRFSGVNAVTLTTGSATGSTIAFNAVASGANTVTINNSDTAGTQGVTINGVGTADTLNLNLRNADLGGATTTTGAETVNLFSSTGINGTAADGAANTATTITLTNTAATETLNISGDVAFTLTGAVTAEVINASTMTAALTMAVGQATVAAGGANITGGTVGDTLVASAQADVINGGGGADNIYGLAGADIITGGAGSDTFFFSATQQGGNTTTVASGTAMTAGDLITDFTSGTGGDLINITAGTTTAAASSGLAGAWNLGTAGLYVLTGANFNFVAGTSTAANVAAVIGAVTSAAGTDTGYIAILDTQGTADASDDQYNIFEVVTASGAKAGAALATTDTISLVGTINGTALLTTDFVA